MKPKKHARKGRRGDAGRGGSIEAGKGYPEPKGLGSLPGYEKVASVPAHVSVYRKKKGRGR